MSLESVLERIAVALEKIAGEDRNVKLDSLPQATLEDAKELSKQEVMVGPIDENDTEEPLAAAFRFSKPVFDETGKQRRERVKKALSFTDFTDNGRQSTNYYEKKLKEILDAAQFNTDHIVIETKKKAAPKPAQVETPQPTTPAAEPTDKPATIAKLNEVGKAHMKKFDYDRTKKILAKYSGNPNMVKTSEIPVEKRNACIAELQGEIDNG